ncbi:MAG: aromatic aminobenezylarsenical efflux permease ArsG family transporter [bacterium]|jgi:hypothetical protein|nr:aromatic aminobenezylarsenical efflux permease ArsG family transporter [bacterium]
MEGMGGSILTALWLGILTSISPCPLAANIAAVSFISRDAGAPRRVLLTGLIYTAGRALCYIGLGFLLIHSLLSIPAVSFWLQKYMNQLLGPLLIMTGMVLLELLSLPDTRGWGTAWMQRIAQQGNYYSAGLLGILFALSFCPVSAALFFGSLIPLATAAQSSVLFPLIYGIGTGLPVLASALVLAFGIHSLNRFFETVTIIEWWTRRITGSLFVLIGIYFCLKYILAILP